MEFNVFAERTGELSHELQRAACLADRREGRAMVARRVGGVEDGERAGLERPYLRYKVVGGGQLSGIASASHLRRQVGGSMPAHGLLGYVEELCTGSGCHIAQRRRD
jgi:hypothetical protein